jgi:hypothetical protein
MRELTSQKQILVDLVRELRLSTTPSDRQKIEDALDEVSGPCL